MYSATVSRISVTSDRCVGRPSSRSEMNVAHLMSPAMAPFQTTFTISLMLNSPPGSSSSS